MDYESFLKLVKTRRTIRKFKADAIPSEDLDKIMETVRWAPSGFNSQPWEILLVQDPETKDVVTQHLQGKGDVDSISRVGFAKAPVYLFLLGDSRVRPWAPPVVRDDEELWRYIMEATLGPAYQHMHLAATSLGIGTMWITASRMPDIEQKIRKTLNIPDHLVLFEMMAIGYPDHTPPNKKVRPLDEFVHYDTCSENEFRTEKDIETYFGKPKPSK
jgi:nitroreductase